MKGLEMADANTYTSFNKRMIGQKFVRFAQVFIALYSITLPAMRKDHSLVEQSIYNIIVL